MDVSALKEVFDHAVLCGCVGAGALLGVGWVGWWLSRLPARVRGLARRLGWSAVVVLGALMGFTAIEGTPTNADKRRWREQRPEGGGEQSVVRPLTAADYAAGLALARVGTGETWDFSAPVGAEVCADWQAFGAAEDWFRLRFADSWTFALGTNAVEALTVFSCGPSCRTRTRSSRRCGRASASYPPRTGAVSPRPRGRLGSGTSSRRRTRSWRRGRTSSSTAARRPRSVSRPSSGPRGAWCSATTSRGSPGRWRPTSSPASRTGVGGASSPRWRGTRPRFGGRGLTRRMRTIPIRTATGFRPRTRSSSTAPTPIPPTRIWMGFRTVGRSARRTPTR